MKWILTTAYQAPSKDAGGIIVSSWSDYLHQRARQTVADQDIEAQLRAMLLPGERVVMQHYIAER